MRGRIPWNIVLVMQVKKPDRLPRCSDIGAFIPNQVDCGRQVIVYLHMIKRATLITDGDRNAIDGLGYRDSLFLLCFLQSRATSQQRNGKHTRYSKIWFEHRSLSRPE